MDPLTIGLALAKVVPMAARWIAGDKAGEAAEKVVEIAQNVAGVDSPQDALKAIQADPALAMEFQKALMANETELDKAYLADRQDARQREIEIVKATGKRDYNLYILAWTVIVGFFVLTGVLAFKKLPEGSSDAVFMLFGALSTGFGTVLSYFFGTSKSSADKTKLLSAKR